MHLAVPARVRCATPVDVYGQPMLRPASLSGVGGIGVTVVALHGNGGGASRFSSVREHMTPDVCLRPVTLPGFGLRPADKRLDSAAGYAERLHDQLAGEPPPVVLLGHGVGASIALELLQARVATVAGAILHSPVGARLDERLLPRLLRLPGAAPLSRRVISSRLTRPVVRRALLADWQRDGPGDALGRGARARTERLLDGYRHCEVFGQMLAVFDADWFAGLHAVDLPAVLLWGERERPPGAAAADDYLRLLPRARVRTVPGWGRFPMVAHPAGYAAEVSDLARALVGATV